MNKSYFVHHKEEKMSSVFSSDYIRAAFSGGEVITGRRLGCVSAIINHNPPTSRSVNPRGGQENHS